MKPLTFSILRTLNDGEFHSGAAIAKIHGVSRSSVSNALRGLDEVGLTIHKVHGRGYRLRDPVQWLERDQILKYLGPQSDAFALEVLDTVESTNTFLQRRAAAELNARNDRIQVVAAELQTGGRGRHGRKWHSGLGDSLTFSLLWRFSQGASFLSGLSLAIGVAILRALESAGIQGATLKWPNDVIFNFCKLAGVLIELQGDMLGPTVAVIGIGMNLRLSDPVRASIPQGTTDLFSMSGKMPDRNRTLAALLIELSRALREFEQFGFPSFKEEWTGRHAYESKTVMLHLPDGSSREGQVKGVADDGSLLLSTPSEVRRYSGGEITLRRAF
ncbi:MAG TPA: biotin--[acetyl-CoA-carboxylase] ligase [Nitrosospira sp.]|nr:biotin--[acetyl-CoA-carboxylase] ligase [Nitrosospira sp.]